MPDNAPETPTPDPFLDPDLTSLHFGRDPQTGQRLSPGDPRVQQARATVEQYFEQQYGAEAAGTLDPMQPSPDRIAEAEQQEAEYIASLPEINQEYLRDHAPLRPTYAAEINPHLQEAAKQYGDVRKQSTWIAFAHQEGFPEVAAALEELTQLGPVTDANKARVFELSTIIDNATLRWYARQGQQQKGR